MPVKISRSLRMVKNECRVYDVKMDDGSTRISIINDNKRIDQLPNFKYDTLEVLAIHPRVTSISLKVEDEDGLIDERIIKA